MAVSQSKNNAKIFNRPVSATALFLSGPAQLARLTTTQRDALTAANGMLVYNTTTNKFQGYENGAWADLI